MLWFLSTKTMSWGSNPTAGFIFFVLKKTRPRGFVRAPRLTLLLSHKRVSRKRLPCRGLFSFGSRMVVRLFTFGAWEFALRRTQCVFVAVAVGLRLSERAGMIPVKSYRGESKSRSKAGFPIGSGMTDFLLLFIVLVFVPWRSAEGAWIKIEKSHELFERSEFSGDRF